MMLYIIALGLLLLSLVWLLSQERRKPVAIVGRVGTSRRTVNTTGPLIMGSIGFLLIMISVALARDPDGRFANSPLKPWFDSLRSGKGPCCSDADGTALSDVDWKSDNGHYTVRIDDEWWDVPDEAVIKEPNRAGRTMVWPIRYWDGKKLTVSIRCFMVGPMT